MKRMITILVVVLAIGIFGISSYAQVPSTNNNTPSNQSSNQNSSVQSTFDQMYQACTNIAGGFMKTVMNTYGKDRMKQMYENYMTGRYGAGMMTGNSSTTNESSQSSTKGFSNGMMNGYGNAYNNNNNGTGNYGYGNSMMNF